MVLQRRWPAAGLRAAPGRSGGMQVSWCSCMWRASRSLAVVCSLGEGRKCDNMQVVCGWLCECRWVQCRRVALGGVVARSLAFKGLVLRVIVGSRWHTGGPALPFRAPWQAGGMQLAGQCSFDYLPSFCMTRTGCHRST